MTEPTSDLSQEPIKPTAWYFEPPQEPHETLRDKFAGMTLSGQLTGLTNWDPDRIAANAYEIADAMMKARGEG